MFKPSSPLKPIVIDKYLGLNESVGETEITPGYSVKQVNFRITQNYKPQKRLGHKTFINEGNTKAIQGMWQGKIDERSVLIYCNNGNVKEYNFETKVTTIIGTITDAKTTIFYFQSKLYFLNGVEYKQYNGTTFQDVIAYEPTIAVATPPTGGGNDFEDSNLLTGYKKQEFTGDGTATVFVIRETNIDLALTTATVNGENKTEITDYTVNRTAAGGATFTFTTAPVAGSVVIPRWSKEIAGNADLVKKNKYAMTFGPGNDTAIFLWGNPNAKNRRSWCGTLNAGYFPVFNFTLIGTNEFAITDIKANNANYQIIFKENRTHYSYAETITLEDGTVKYDYPVKDLNEKVGNVAFNGVQIVNNNPISLKDQSWWYWSNTNVENERNADIISERIRESLSNLDLSQAVTFDNQNEKEYWCNVGSMVYIWNYGNDTMYSYNNIQATCFLDIAGVIYYGASGTIEKFEGYSDNGVATNPILVLPFMDFGAFEMKKNSRDLFISIQVYERTSCIISYETNKLNEPREITKKIEYVLLDFNNIDFNRYTFSTNRNPQTFYRKIRAKKYSYIKFIIENREIDEPLVFLSLKVQSESQGENK